MDNDHVSKFIREERTNSHNPNIGYFIYSSPSSSSASLSSLEEGEELLLAKNGTNDTVNNDNKVNKDNTSTNDTTAIKDTATQMDIGTANNVVLQINTVATHTVVTNDTIATSNIANLSEMCTSKPATKASCHGSLLFSKLQQLQRIARKKTKRRKRSINKLPAHNPFVGYFHHSRLEDPINMFLRDCAPATPILTPKHNIQKDEKDEKTKK